MRLLRSLGHAEVKESRTRFRQVKEAIRTQGCDMVINFSTSGGAGRSD